MLKALQNLSKKVLSTFGVHNYTVKLAFAMTFESAHYKTKAKIFVRRRVNQGPIESKMVVVATVRCISQQKQMQNLPKIEIAVMRRSISER